MSTQADQLGERVIVTGRAYEAADVLLSQNPALTERVLLRLVRALYSHRLRDLVAVLPGDITGEILAASDKMTGPVRGFGDN